MFFDIATTYRRHTFSVTTTFTKYRCSVQDTQNSVALYALGTYPRKSIPVTQGKRDLPSSFGGVEFRPGDYVHTESDGVIVMPEALR